MDLIGSELFVFIDDLIVFSKSAEEHAIRPEHVLQRLEKANLQLHPGKCVFAQPRVRYIGFELSESGVSACADKVNAVKEYPTAKNVKDVKSIFRFSIFLQKISARFCRNSKTHDTSYKEKPSIYMGS